MTQTVELVACSVCGSEFKPYGRKRRQANQNFCSRDCYWAAKRKYQSWSFERWDEGFVKDDRFRVYVPGHHRADRDGYVFRSIVVYEQTHECQVLWPEDVIHHVNHDTLDDRPENLKLLRNGSHTSLHRTKRRPYKQCLCCGDQIRAKDRGNYLKQRFCSHGCYVRYRFAGHQSKWEKTCLNCDLTFVPKDRGKHAEAQRFCSRSCASSWNMTQRWRRGENPLARRALVAV